MAFKKRAFTYSQRGRRIMKKSKTVIAISLAFLLSATLVSCKTSTKPNDGKDNNNSETKITSMTTADASSEKNTDESTDRTSQDDNSSKDDSSSKTTTSESTTETAKAKTLEGKILQAGLTEVDKENFKYSYYVILEKDDKWVINFVSEDGKSSQAVKMTKRDYKILNSTIKNWEAQDIPNNEEDYNKIADKLFAEIENLERGTAGSSLKNVGVAADYLNLIAEDEYSTYEFYVYLNEYRTKVAEQSEEALERFDNSIRATIATADMLVATDETAIGVLKDAGKSLSEAAMTMTEADASPYLWFPFNPDFN